MEYVDRCDGFSFSAWAFSVVVCNRFILVRVSCDACAGESFCKFAAVDVFFLVIALPTPGVIVYSWFSCRGVFSLESIEVVPDCGFAFVEVRAIEGPCDDPDGRVWFFFSNFLAIDVDAASCGDGDGGAFLGGLGDYFEEVSCRVVIW